MQPNKQFLGKSQQFWGYVRVISEKIKYSKGGIVKEPDEHEIYKKLKQVDISIPPSLIDDIISYLQYRANTINNEVRNNLMDLNEARTLFTHLHNIYRDNNFTCKLPYNKQKNEKSDFAFFTCIINILTENHLRNFASMNNLTYGFDICFNDDPSNLTYLKDSNNEILGTLSRRFDGAYPNTINPKAIWEIKEYYYTTTFGSRIADGVYETQLDGFEINELSHQVEGDIKHVYFIDARDCWWKDGKSYLCRIIDMLHIGLVDEVIVGKEVVSRWRDVLDGIVKDELSFNK